MSDVETACKRRRSGLKRRDRRNAGAGRRHEGRAALCDEGGGRHLARHDHRNLAAPANQSHLRYRFQETTLHGLTDSMAEGSFRCSGAAPGGGSS
jgi:hypothetical protein